MSGEIYGKKHDSLLSKNLQRYVKHGVCCGHVQAYVAYVCVFVTSRPLYMSSTETDA